MKKSAFFVILFAFLFTISSAFAGTFTKGPAGKEDISLWYQAGTDSRTYTRPTSTGYNLTLHKFDWVGIDVGQVYGAGVNYTDSEISDALTDIGATDKRTIWLAPTTWNINDDLTITSNVMIVCPAGCILNIAAGKTLTINGPFEAGLYQVFSGAGSVSGLLLTKPKWWGAVGDGTTNDTTASQAAATALAQYGILDLGGYHYAVTGISISTDDAIIRDGWLVAHADTAGDHVIKADSTTSGVQFKNLNIYIDKAAITSTDCAGIYLDQCAKAKVINCFVNGSRNDNYGAPRMESGIYGYGATESEVINCKVINSDQEGIMFESCDDTYISDCEGRDTGKSAIGTHKGSRATISNCRAFDTGASGITMNSQDSIVSDCLIKDNTAANGITVGHSASADTYANDCVVSNNRVINSAAVGITVQCGINVTVEGNVITDSADDGIQVKAHPSTHGVSVIKGNSVESSGGEGIYYVAFQAYGSVIIDSNGVYNSTDNGVYVFALRDAVVSNNLIDTVGDSGIRFIGTTPVGAAGLLTASATGNTIKNTNWSGIVCANLHAIIATGNIFTDINTASAATCGALAIARTAGGVNSHMPTSALFEDNVVKDIDSTGVVIYIEANALDSVITHATIKGNSVEGVARSDFFTIGDPTKTYIYVSDNHGYRSNSCVFGVAGAGVADGAVDGKAKTTNAITYEIDGIVCTRAATDNLFDLTGVATGAAEYKKVLLGLNSAGNGLIVEGAVAATQAAAQLPSRRKVNICIVGVVEIDNNYAGGDLAANTFYDIIGSFNEGD